MHFNLFAFYDFKKYITKQAHIKKNWNIGFFFKFLFSNGLKNSLTHNHLIRYVFKKEMYKVHFDNVCFWKKRRVRDWVREREGARDRERERDKLSHTEIVSMKEIEKKRYKIILTHSYSYVRCLILAILNTYLVLKLLWLLWNLYFMPYLLTGCFDLK